MIKIEKILMPTGLSEYARHALGYATDMASTFGAMLHFIYVVDIAWIATLGGIGPPGQRENVLERLTEAGEADL